MLLEWDETKRESNIKRHGLDFVDAWEVFLAPMLTDSDIREDYGEDRTVGIGYLRTLVVVIVFTEPDSDIIRVISMRKATSHERSASNPISRTDWAKVAALTDSEIDTSDAPPLDDVFFARARVRMPNRPLAEVTLHIDPLVLRWFQNQSTQYERLINAALRIYVDAHASYDISPDKP